MGHVESIVHAWRRFWFAPATATNLAICRFVYVAIVLCASPVRAYGPWATVPEDLWEPTPFFGLLGLIPASASSLDLSARMLEAALVAAAVGLLTRISCAVAAVLSFYLFGLTQSFGIVYHGTATVPLVLLVLAVARSGDALSLDSVLVRLARRGSAEKPVAQAEYRWPVRLAQSLLVLVFFAAGVAKLRRTGLVWAFSDNLRETLIVHHYLLIPPTSDIGLTLAEYPTLCMVGAISILAAETLAPLALFSCRAAAVLVPTLLAFCLALPLLFGFGFYGLQALFVFWVPWDRLVGVLRLRAATGPRGST